MEGLKFAHEKTAVETDIIAPICAAIHRDSWIDFLPINWYSDDIQCMMMQEKGMHNIVSTAYVHHVGSQSMQSPEIEIANSLNYIKENYSSYYRKLEQCHLRLNWYIGQHWQHLQFLDQAQSLRQHCYFWNTYLKKENENESVYWLRNQRHWFAGGWTAKDIVSWMFTQQAKPPKWKMSLCECWWQNMALPSWCRVRSSHSARTRP